MRSPASFLLLLQLAFLLVLVRCSASSTCYNPDGTPSYDIPCQDTFYNYSACCDEKDACLSNGLCFSELKVARRSCTDITWRAPECPSQCIKSTLIFFFLSVHVITWISNTSTAVVSIYANVWGFIHKDNPSIGGKDLKWCGGMIFACDDDDCLTSNFTLSDAHVVLRDDQIKTLVPSSTSASTFVGGTPTPSATSTTLGLISTPSTTCPTLGSAPACTKNDFTPRFTQGCNIVAVGAGLGVSLGITILVLVVLTVLFTVEKRRSQRLMQENRQMMTENEIYKGQIWMNRRGSKAEAPQDLAQHQMPSGPLAHELTGIRNESGWDMMAIPGLLASCDPSSL